MDDPTLVAARDEIFDFLVIGAGPTGLACAIEAQKAGFRRGAGGQGLRLQLACFTIPAHMTFFTTPELLEIGDIPFPSPNPEAYAERGAAVLPAGGGVLQARRAAVQRVERVTGADGAFAVHTEDRFGRPGELRRASWPSPRGYYDLPNYMGIPGEDWARSFTTIMILTLISGWMLW